MVRASAKRKLSQRGLSYERKPGLLALSRPILRLAPRPFMGCAGPMIILAEIIGAIALGYALLCLAAAKRD
jgi:hypothetical protein